MRIIVEYQNKVITFDNNSPMTEHEKIAIGTADYENQTFIDGELSPIAANEELIHHINNFLILLQDDNSTTSQEEKK